VGRAKQKKKKKADVDLRTRKERKKTKLFSSRHHLLNHPHQVEPLLLSDDTQTLEK
jgi:hypothetical protein